VQSLASSRPATRQLVPFVGEGVPRATRVRFVVFVFARKKPSRADDRSGLLPRCVSSRGGQLFAQQKGQRLRAFEAVCPSRLSRRLRSFDPSVRLRRCDGLMIRGRVSRRGRSRIRLPPAAARRRNPASVQRLSNGPQSDSHRHATAIFATTRSSRDPSAAIRLPLPAIPSSAERFVMLRSKYAVQSRDLTTLTSVTIIGTSSRPQRHSPVQRRV
jgi:hypothetical protein